MNYRTLLLAGIVTIALRANAQVFEAANKADWPQVMDLVHAQPDLVKARNDGHTGETLLQIACESGPTNLVVFLIDKGADLNAADKYGITPLLKAIDENREDGEESRKTVIGILVAKGANVKLADKYGMTPLHRATKGTDTDVVDLLLHAGADINARQKVQIPVQNHSDVDAQAMSEAMDELSSGDTPLLLAAKAGNFAIAEHLIKKGADVNIADKLGRTPLHVASLLDDALLINLLLKNKANVNAKTNGGSTPLDLAKNASNGCVDTLLRHGAKEATPPNEEDSSREFIY